MVSECANPQCATPFRYLTKGSLLVAKKPSGRGLAMTQRHVEWFWLCERCSPWFEIWIDLDGRSTCVSRSSFSLNTNSRKNTAAHLPAA